MQSFFNSVRLVWGEDALGELAGLAKSIGMSKALIVTDKTIGGTACAERIRDVLKSGGITFRVFDECGIDARASHIQSEKAKLASDGIDGIIGLGGGSVMCTAKGIATLATNGDEIRPLEKQQNIKKRPMPLLLIPTTAGSGTEVSPFTIVKDDINGGKFTFGNQLCFAHLAVLDPATLESLPQKIAAVSAVDALTHSLEALFSKIATPLTDALALEAARMLFGSMAASIVKGEPKARLDNLVGSSIANMACGQARLGLAHRLSRPLEENFTVAHGLGVGTLMPRTINACAGQFPEKLVRLAETIGVGRRGDNAGDLRARLVEKIFALYEEVGFPSHFDAVKIDRSRLRQMAETAVSRTTDATGKPEIITSNTQIVAANFTSATVAEAHGLYDSCFA
ncbi:MAG: hypothetical protein RLZ98_472 [Pseudomonadota bacterium]|jgi:alcohol dehydrogenase class IV